MNDDRTFERDARAWLELGPTDLPDRVVVDTLRAIELTPQERRLRVPWNGFRFTPPLRLATAALIAALALGSGMYLLGHPAPVLDSPSPRPSASPMALDPRAWIVFQAQFSRDIGNSAAETDPQVWLVHADGSGLHELAPQTPPGGKTSFDISPDGRRVAFASASQIWEVAIDGELPVLLSTPCACWEDDPTYSADGTKIAFIRREGTDAAPTYVVGIRDLTTGVVRLLESTRVGSSADVDRFLHRTSWSPDGSRIAYGLRTRDWPTMTGHARIEVAAIDGGAPTELPLPPGYENAGAPDWSPDGSVILFSTAVGGTGFASSAGNGMWTVYSDGSELTLVCLDCLGHGRMPSWTPDGLQILFWSGSSWGLMDAAGGNQHFINPALTFPAIWSEDGAFAQLQATP